jgi:Domain of unknown function (DUF4440)
MHRRVHVLLTAPMALLAVLVGPTSLCAAASAEETATSKRLIAWERQWAEEDCTHRSVLKEILAEDFYGTAPRGSRYDKTEALSDDGEKVQAKDCRLLSAEVRYHGRDVAVVYGSESAVKGRDGAEPKRICLVWTDTWLRRQGTWQIIAVQDAYLDCPQE